MAEKTRKYKVKIEAPGHKGAERVTITLDPNSRYWDWEYEAEWKARVTVARQLDCGIQEIQATQVMEVAYHPAS